MLTILGRNFCSDRGELSRTSEFLARFLSLANKTQVAILYVMCSMLRVRYVSQF